MRLWLRTCLLLCFAHATVGLSEGTETATANPESTLPTREDISSTYSGHPVWTDILLRLPEDYLAFGSRLMSHPRSTYALVAGATLGLAPFDGSIQRESRGFATRNGWLEGGSQERRAISFKLFGAQQGIFFPRSFMGSLWYLGDGSTWVATAGGFAAFGYWNDDYRASHVAFQILEALTIAGPTVLAIKLATGRESPAEAHSSGGAWHGYPGLKTYASNQARYYSYPSGHLTAAFTAMTVIAKNYPEKQWIGPLRGVVSGLLMFALMNVNSHWPSDYPLAMLIGYSSAEAVVEQSRARDRARGPHTSDGLSTARSWVWQGIHPHVNDGYSGLYTSWDF